MKFLKTKFSSLDDKTIVALTSDDDKFSLKADLGGLAITGELKLESEKDLQEFAKLMSDAWTEHRKLKPKFHRTLSGH